MKKLSEPITYFYAFVMLLAQEKVLRTNTCITTIKREGRLLLAKKALAGVNLKYMQF